MHDGRISLKINAGGMSGGVKRALYHLIGLVAR